MWVARSDDGGPWLSRPGPRIAEIIGESGYFGTAVETSYSTRLSVPASSVVDLENTRATSLSWPDDERRAFTEELRGHLTTESVGLTQVATVTMAQVARFHEKRCSVDLGQWSGRLRGRFRRTSTRLVELPCTPVA